MIIKKNISADDVEKIITEIQSNSPPTSVRLPSSIKFKGIGVEAALTQAIVTWCRNSQFGELHTYLNEESLNSESHLKFITSFLGIISGSLVPKISFENHKPIERIDFLTPASQMINDMDDGNFEGLRRGAEIKLITISGSSKRFIKSVFEAPRRVKKPTYLKGVIRESLEVILPPSGDAKGVREVTDKLLPQLSWMVFELFQNVCDHAEKDEHGNIYPRTIGALKLAIQKFTNSEDVSRVISNESQSYLKKTFGKNNNFRFLELSMLDNGPGLARRWKGLSFSEMTIEDEKKAVIECLEKGKSSKNKVGHGYGLNNVMGKLKEVNGFLRVRTGRLLVEKSFSDSFSQVVIEEKDFSQELPAVEGLLISILIPIIKKET